MTEIDTLPSFCYDNTHSDAHVSLAQTMNEFDKEDSYFWEEFFLIEAFNQFKMFTALSSLYSCPVYLERHGLELAFYISLNFDWNWCLLLGGSK